MGQEIKVLAVADPAIGAYTDPSKGLLRGFPLPVQFDVQPWASYYPAMMDTLQGKGSYDVVMVAGHLWKRDFVQQGYLLPVDQADEDVLPAIRREMQYDNVCYISPSFCDGHMVVYRKSLLLQQGLALPGDVLQPAEYIAIIKALGADSVAMKAHPSEIFTDALPFLRMYGGDAYGPDGSPVCDDPAVIAGLEEYCALRAYALPSTSQFGNEEVAAALRSRQCAIATTWSGQLGVVAAEGCEQQSDLGYATLSTAWNVTWGFAVSAASKHPGESRELLRHLCSPEVDRIAGAVSGAPVRRTSYQQGADLYPWYTCQRRMIESARQLPDSLHAGERNQCLYQQIALAFAGEKTPQKAMQDAKEQIHIIDQGGK